MQTQTATDSPPTQTSDHTPVFDMALAAYLVSEGYPQPDIELKANSRYPDGYKAIFLFEGSPKLKHHMHLYFTAEATANVSVFLDAMHKLRKRLKSEIRLARA